MRLINLDMFTEDLFLKEEMPCVYNGIDENGMIKPINNNVMHGWENIFREASWNPDFGGVCFTGETNALKPKVVNTLLFRQAKIFRSEDNTQPYKDITEEFSFTTLKLDSLLTELPLAEGALAEYEDLVMSKIKEIDTDLVEVGMSDISKYISAGLALKLSQNGVWVVNLEGEKPAIFEPAERGAKELPDFPLETIVKFGDYVKTVYGLEITQEQASAVMGYIMSEDSHFDPTDPNVTLEDNMEVLVTFLRKEYNLQDVIPARRLFMTAVDKPEQEVPGMNYAIYGVLSTSREQDIALPEIVFSLDGTELEVDQLNPTFPHVAMTLTEIESLVRFAWFRPFFAGYSSQNLTFDYEFSDNGKLHIKVETVKQAEEQPEEYVGESSGESFAKAIVGEE